MLKQFAVLAATLIGLPALAGTLTVEINDPSATPATHTYQHTGLLPSTIGPVTFGAGSEPDITIELGAVSSPITIRIFDSATSGTSSDPQVGIGRLKLNGSASATGRLSVLVADGDQLFPATLSLADGLRPGLTTFGGTLPSTSFSDSQQAHDYDQYPWASVNSGGDSNAYDTDPNTPGFQVDDRLRGIIIPDPSLRRQTVLAAVVSQDVCPGWDAEVGSKGRIEVGQVLRLHAIGSVQSDGTVIDGNINAHVIAIARDQYLTYGDINDPPTPTLPGVAVAPSTTGFRAIENVTGGNAIRGSVIARGRAYDDGLDATTGSFVGVR
ncbi:MAG: hypothetical protein Q8L55_00680 [Phycisphaerales bacterium]|nr:hypothetical protein [Phycisphaerales bacterium]